MDMQLLQKRKCPCCEQLLNSYYCEDTVFNKNKNIAFMIMIGECVHCDKKFSWTEAYTFKEVTDLEITDF